MPYHARDADDWPRIIHRMWRVAQVERKRLSIDLVDGACLVIGAASIATRADIVEFVDEDGLRRSLVYADIAAVLLTP